MGEHKIGDTWYRIEDGTSQNWTRTFHVVKVTPCGVQLSDVFGMRRLVLNGVRKQFACPTMEDAIESFVRRKTRQLQILRAQIRRVERALEEARTGSVPPDPCGFRLMDSEDLVL